MFIWYDGHFLPCQLTLQSDQLPVELGLLRQFKKRGLPAFHTLELCCLSAGTSELSVTRRTRAWTGKTSEMPPFPRWQPIDDASPKCSLRRHETTVVISLITARFMQMLLILSLYLIFYSHIFTRFLSCPDINACSLCLCPLHAPSRSPVHY